MRREVTFRHPIGDTPRTVTFLDRACQAGTLRSAHYDLDARTITPLVG
jgi:hypothetical protein